MSSFWIAQNKIFHHISYRGTPQIEVTSEIDVNGILNVEAVDKAVGKSAKITITNEKGRLSQEEIERMVHEAEEFSEEDNKLKEKIDARNSLETYVYNIKNTVSDKDKLSDRLVLLISLMPQWPETR